MGKRIVAGNWKMNKTLDEGQNLASEVVTLVNEEVQDDVSVILCPPFTSLGSLGKLLEGNKLHLGAQNCHTEESGAYTGEVSAPMLKSIAVEYVILGHSERREHFNESNEELKKKTDIALSNNLKPIFCCGESLEQRENGEYLDFVKNQISESLFHLDKDSFSQVVIAYEPIWAIGTGKTATSDQAQDMHAEIRKHIAEKYGQDVADNTSILYGGSCKPGNAKELFACKDVDGGLIGGASLKARDFVDIIKSF